ncbi:hypothetical protein Syn7502_00075 [Synechococcus sp. PCC 7502]|nr:hypothetical protein Syn7502_00075 [Synechococcus sp. PCC 7502]
MSETRSQVQWLQVWSLALVQGAISLAWVVYGIYLPKFIEQVFAYSLDQAQQLTGLIFVIEGAIAVIIEPVFGGLSDRWQRWFSSRIPLIVAGTIVSTGLYIALPCVVIFGGANALTQLVLPSLAILWAIAMATFRSPLLSLLGRFASETQLPQAASIVTLVGGFISSIRPLATNFIVGLGAPITFTIASISLLAGVAGLRFAIIYVPKAKKTEVEIDQNQPIRASLKNLIIILVVGTLIGLSLRLLLGEVIPHIFTVQISPFLGISVPILIGAAFIAQSLFALIFGAIAKKIENRFLMIWSLLGMTGCLGLLSITLFINNVAIASSLIILLLLACMSIVNNGTIPFALTMVPKSLAGIGVGTYFGGVSLAVSSFGFLRPKFTEIFSISNFFLITAITFLGAGVGIFMGYWLQAPSKVE